jgi:hypothetical protein
MTIKMAHFLKLYLDVQISSNTLLHLKCCVWTVLTGLSLLGIDKHSSADEPVNSSKTPLKTTLLELLNSADVDEEMRKKRDALSTAAPRMPPEGVDQRFPRTYAFEKIVSYGKVIAPDLAVLACDESLSESSRQYAWQALLILDDRQYFRPMVKGFNDGTVKGYSVAILTMNYIPVDWTKEYSDDEALKAWLQRFLKKDEKDYEAARLELIDAIMLDTKGIKTHRMHIFRWLNRWNGVDFDEWLRVKAPDALEYRNRCRQKGYDPVFAFYSFSRNLFDGVIDEGINKVVNEDDRMACRKLMCAAYDYSNKSGLYCDGKMSESETIAWYRQFRNILRFDSTLRQFVVPATTEARGKQN